MLPSSIGQCLYVYLYTYIYIFLYICIFLRGNYMRFPIHASLGRLDASQQVKVLRSTYSYALSEAQSTSDEITIPQSQQVLPFCWPRTEWLKRRWVGDCTNPIGFAGKRCRKMHLNDKNPGVMARNPRRRRRWRCWRVGGSCSEGRTGTTCFLCF